MENTILKLRKELNMSQEKFGKDLGVGKTAISKLEKGDNNITNTMSKLICTTYNVNEEWLHTGEGDMFEKNNPSNSIVKMAAKTAKKNKASFQKDFLYALSQLTEEQWKSLEDIMDTTIKNITYSKNKDGEA